MKCLSDSGLIEAYIKAKELELDPNFIQLLEVELKRRSISIHLDETQKKQNG
ncbi:sporulation histidine kinase inhibitor Sda [Lederbergia sp. NSJ-179]|nr:sporulation histidine kinase inhibitor Sda [Lederbergia sp. NSJ-179]MCJ7843090.1 sporulation histidine kinase inhibitor Sda [Lederbergia sp. NSJ-179]